MASKVAGVATREHCQPCVASLLGNFGKRTVTTVSIMPTCMAMGFLPDTGLTFLGTCTEIKEFMRAMPINFVVLSDVYTWSARCGEKEHDVMLVMPGDNAADYIECLEKHPCPDDLNAFKDCLLKITHLVTMPAPRHR